MKKLAPVAAFLALLSACSADYTTSDADDAEVVDGAEGPVGAGASALAGDRRLDGVLACQAGNGLPGGDGLGGACRGVVEVEPNDTSAVAATTGEHLCGAVAGADVDVIKVPLGRGEWLGYAVQASAPIEVSITGGAKTATGSRVAGATCSSSPRTVLLTVRARAGVAARYTIHLQRR